MWTDVLIIEHHKCQGSDNEHKSSLRKKYTASEVENKGTISIGHYLYLKHLQIENKDERY